MNVSGLLLECYGRIPPLAEAAVAGLDAATLAQAPAPGANTIGWLVWHLSRVADSHIAELAGEVQVWERDDWGPRFGLVSDPENTGYGHRAEDVTAVRPDGPDTLVGYLRAVTDPVAALLETLDEAALDHIVDRRWDPPVTMGVRLVSVADDCLQHAGQAAYLRGLLVR